MVHVLVVEVWRKYTLESQIKCNVRQVAGVLNYSIFNRRITGFRMLAKLFEL